MVEIEEMPLSEMRALLKETKSERADDPTRGSCANYERDEIIALPRRDYDSLLERLTAVEQRYTKEITPRYSERVTELERNVSTVIASYQDELTNLQERLNQSLAPYVTEFEKSIIRSCNAWPTLHAVPLSPVC